MSDTELSQALTVRLRAGNVRVPPYPAVVAKLQRLLVDERCGLQAIACVVASDPVLTAAVLRHANSAAMRRAEPVASLEVAVKAIGADDLLRLAMSAVVGATAMAPGPLVGLRRDIWRRSLLSAHLCYELASHHRVQPDAAFLAGLLHDFGAIAVVGTIEDIARERDVRTRSAEAWHSIIDQHHVEFGVAVAKRWQLPAVVADVIAQHHDPASTSPSVRLVAALDAVIAASEAGAELQMPAELDKIDRARIEAALPRVAAQLTSFEGDARAAVAAKSHVAAEQPADDGWRVSFLVSTQQVYQATQLWSDMIAFDGPRPLMPNWVATIVLECEPQPIDLMVNVRSCEQRGNGFAITAKPFALGGEVKDQWIALVHKIGRTARALQLG